MTPDVWLADERFHRRFWSKVNRCGPDECWEWTAGRKPPSGYGHFYLGNGAHTTASRVALALSLGRTLDRSEFVGTGADNALDSVAKGRANRARGSAHRDAKLTEAQVREIRAVPRYWGLNTDLALAYGVSNKTIDGIRARRTWRHLP